MGLRNDHDISFCNGESKCGCKVLYSSGHGEYSDAIYIKLCRIHNKQQSDKGEVEIFDAYESGFVNGRMDSELTLEDGWKQYFEKHKNTEGLIT